MTRILFNPSSLLKQLLPPERREDWFMAMELGINHLLLRGLRLLDGVGSLF